MTGPEAQPRVVLYAILGLGVVQVTTAFLAHISGNREQTGVIRAYQGFSVLCLCAFAVSIFILLPSTTNDYWTENCEESLMLAQTSFLESHYCPKLVQDCIEVSTA
jgi:hypothetical protein